MQTQRIGFIGAGQMARALARGFVAAGRARAADIDASDPSPESLGGFAEQVPGCATHADNTDVAARAETLFLAVKPQVLDGVLAGLAPRLSERHLVVSVVAGATLARLAEGLAPGVRLIRVMPNTPCLVGHSASAYSLGPSATEQDGATIDSLLSAVGQAWRLDERLLDAVTGLSGSGPAYIGILIEALSDGGVRMGLPRAVATALAVQTVRGTAELLLQTGEHPAALKDRVASPGGTTIAGLQALEAHGFRAALMAAVEAATRRSEELGRRA